MSIRVATIGFTQTTAENFFDRIRASGSSQLIDVRLNNTSQLSGFAKAKDLAFFLNEICGVKYRHMPILAPDSDMLSAYKKKKGSWHEYRDKFLGLMSKRQIENKLTAEILNNSCLLCSEAKPHHCHRTLVCEYLNSKWGSSLIVRHL